MNRSQSEIAALILENRIAEIFISLPAKIVSYDFATQKASVKPLINDKYSDGKTKVLPIINNVPVQFPSSQEAIVHYPINAGLEVTLLFSQRSLEEWLDNGGEVVPDDPRINNLTDAIAIVGRLKPFGVPSLAENNDDFLIKFKNSKIVLKKNGDAEITATNVSIIATKTTINGDLEATGTIKAAGNIESQADIKASDKSFLGHIHSGVTSGSSNTGGIV